MQILSSFFFAQGENIFKALVNISTRKVKTRIVQNPPDSEFPDLDSLALAKAGAALVQNLNVSALIGSGVLHTKLLVVDQRHFYVGSANMDWRSLTQVGIIPLDRMHNALTNLRYLKPNRHLIKTS